MTKQNQLKELYAELYSINKELDANKQLWLDDARTYKFYANKRDELNHKKAICSQKIIILGGNITWRN